MKMKLNLRVGMAALAMAALLVAACKKGSRDVKEIESHRVNDVVISLLSETGGLAQGQNQFTVAFRSASTNRPIDVGKVSVNSAMTMPGMPMSAGIELEPAGETGRYTAKGNFGMSGSWRFEVRWDGPAGQGSAAFNSSVR